MRDRAFLMRRGIKVCKKENALLESRTTKAGHQRLFCPVCNKFVFKKDIHTQTEQEYRIALELEQMNERLANIWNLAFHTKGFPKMQKGIPEYSIGDLFILLHVIQYTLRGQETEPLIVKIWRGSRVIT